MVNKNLSRPIFTKVNYDTFEMRRPEGVVGIRGGICPYYGSCNHCSLPSYSDDKVGSEDIKRQINCAFDDFVRKEKGIKVLSMYNAGSAFNEKEIPSGILDYFFNETFRLKKEGIFPYLEKVSVESREGFISRDRIGRSVDLLGDLKLGFVIYVL